LELSLVIGAVFENGNTESIRQFFIVEVSLIIGFLGGDKKERFALNINFFVGMQF
jgi:hypothetical protein